MGRDRFIGRRDRCSRESGFDLIFVPVNNFPAKGSTGADGADLRLEDPSW
jgi:hypothetical protein